MDEEDNVKASQITDNEEVEEVQRRPGEQCLPGPEGVLPIPSPTDSRTPTTSKQPHDESSDAASFVPHGIGSVNPGVFNRYKIVLKNGKSPTVIFDPSRSESLKINPFGNSTLACMLGSNVRPLDTPEQSIFSPLTASPLVLVCDKTNLLPESLSLPRSYEPNCHVARPELKSALAKIGEVCRFLDLAFAEYFKTSIGKLTHIGQELEYIRSRSESKAISIGSFGEWCERVNHGKLNVGYAAVKTDVERIEPYLRDALEVPYWNMMVQTFLRNKHNNSSFTCDMVFSVVNDKLRELNIRSQKAQATWPGEIPPEVINGIQRRISVLDDLLEPASDKYNSLEERKVQALQRSSTSELESSNISLSQTAYPSTTLATQSSASGAMTDLEKISSLNLFFVLSGLAVIPLILGACKYWNAPASEAIGSASDADFMNLIATTILAIFGNIYAVIPLRKITRGSTASILSYTLLYMSLTSGLVSITVYCFCNKVWPSSLAFLCGYFALGSTFASTQYVSDTALTGQKPSTGTKDKAE